MAPELRYISAEPPSSRCAAQVSHVFFRSFPLLTVLRNTVTCTYFGCLILGAASAFGATPSTNGQSGYVNMPSALVEPDGTFSVGYSFDRPYGALWVTSTILPSLQMTGRFVSINGIPGFTNDPGQYGSEYGRYKDKVVDAKLRLWNENGWLPAVAIGGTDLLGTELFKGQYVVATKHFGPAHNIEASIGVGRKRPDGVFGGVRWTPQNAPNWSVVGEYDANDYAKDFRAEETAAGSRRKGPSLALEYRWGWLGAQVARHRDHFSANVSVSIPFNQKEFLPKLQEPAYFQAKDAPARPTLDQWEHDQRYGAALVQALARQDYKNVRVRVHGRVLYLSLTNNRISTMGRAVGRAARTALAFAPVDARTIVITYTQNEQPVTTYEFVDLPSLSNYLTGLIKRDQFLPTVLVRYSNPADRIDDNEHAMLAGVKDDDGISVQTGRDGNIVQVSSEDREANRFKVIPRLGFFFNDPSGALRYEVAAAANYDKRLGTGLYLNSAFKLNLFENITGVTQPSNSLLPHVRTDIAEYKRGGRFKMAKIMVNQYLQPSERWYARASLGCYEEMFCGAGGQIMYLPKDERWAADMTVDGLQQRGYKGWFDTRDYRTVTALAALHYRLPYGMTATARAGKFLAKDEGVRMELKRRFRSGIEIGAWYTKTNGKDTTGPGTPGNPYNDKGVYLTLALNSMLLSDTQATSSIAIAPWTRDVGQMVASPGDLYDMIEQPRRDMTSYDGLGNFAERKDEQNLPAVTPPVSSMGSSWPAFRMRFEQSASSGPRIADWAKGTGVAAGAVLASALLDKPIDRFMRKHADSRIAKTWSDFGKNMPVALVGLAGVSVAFGDERMQNMGLISLQSVAGSLGVSTAAKYLVQRARPTEERGAWECVGDGQSRSSASFPSRHAAVAFAAVTPFAQEYEAPWLYGVAAVSSMGRVAGRQHWVSDTVAGGIMGYAVGSWLWQAQRDNTKSRLSIVPGPKEISMAWRGSY